MDNFLTFICMEFNIVHKPQKGIKFRGAGKNGTEEWDVGSKATFPVVNWKNRENWSSRKRGVW